jgi:predicted small secreted protein
MKEKMFGVAALLVAGVLVLSGCNKTENNPVEEPEV